MFKKILRSAALRHAGLRNLGAWYFRADDVFAARHGWQVLVRHGGLSRTYRDPRFDQLRQCPYCCGAGVLEDDQPCPRCEGTGRIELQGARR